MFNELLIDPALVQEFLNISIKEFKERSWGASQQYLEVIEITTENGIPIIARVDEREGVYAVYFKVNTNKFYYTHYFTANPAVELVGIEITPSSKVLLRVNSESVDLNDILSQTTLSPTKIWEKGDLRPPKRLASFTYKESGFQFELDKNHAGDIEEKLLELLCYLEGYDSELQALKKMGCELSTDIYWEAYISNSLVGGFNLTKHVIEKLNILGIGLSFDVQVTGTPFK